MLSFIPKIYFFFWIVISNNFIFNLWKLIIQLANKLNFFRQYWLFSSRFNCFPVKSRDDNVEHCDDKTQAHRARVEATLASLAWRRDAATWAQNQKDSHRYNLEFLEQATNCTSWPRTHVCPKKLLLCGCLPNLSQFIRNIYFLRAFKQLPVTHQPVITLTL